MPVSRDGNCDAVARGLPGIPGFDQELTAGGHCVACIHRHIQDHLFDLSRIRAHGLQVRGELDDQFDLFAQHASQHALHLLHQRVEVDKRRAHTLPAAEREQLPSKIRRALGRLDHLLQILSARDRSDAWRPAACANSR